MMRATAQPIRVRRSALGLADGVATADVVVLGSGVAGLTAALSLLPRRVVVMSKGPLASGSSRWAQGGIAAAMGEGDDPAHHADDTLAAGVGLSDPAVVHDLISEAPEHVRRLLSRGVRFDRGADGRLSLGREGAHSHHRILHCGGDATGAEMVRALVDSVLAEQAQHGRIETATETFAEDLVVEDGRVVGVLAQRADGRRVLYRTGAVVLATGGCGQLWSKTTNPPEVTGDGLAMAARAGAVLADLEMIQFHPTALDVGAAGGAFSSGASLPLLTEALRGEGATLIDGSGQRFMPAIDPRAELAPRDVVARAIYRRMAAGDSIHLDARDAVGDAFPDRFPTVWRACRGFGIDPRRQPMPVTPAAHYAMAGVDVDTHGRTSLDGLWACGEVTSSGLHGANRLASNSLLEGVIFGARVADDIASKAIPRVVDPRRGAVLRPRAALASDVESPRHRRALRAMAWQHLGLERDRAGLVQVLDWLDTHAAPTPRPSSDLDAAETANLHDVATLVASAALAREESRGAHHRLDHPQTDPARAQRATWTFDAISATLIRVATEAARRQEIA